MIEHRPLLFIPYFKQVIWGGTKICDYKGISHPASDIGESWEISVVPGQESVVEKGRYQGWPLSRLIRQFGENILGGRVFRKYGGKFPLLVKFIDAHDRLSVQVHPDDRLAWERHESMGKSELWYIISSKPGAKIYVGLKEQLSPDDFSRRVAEGTFINAVAESESNPGDVFFLPAGRVHAIGAGNLLVEIQQSSDITYRIYDYDRRDSQGKLRDLHTAEARDAIDYTIHESYKNPPIPPDEKESRLVSCDHFTTTLYRIDSDRLIPTDPESFSVVICIEGEMTISCRDGGERIRQGHTLLIPAEAEYIRASGKGTILVTQA